jgi:hypothetical protein
MSVLVSVSLLIRSHDERTRVFRTGRDALFRENMNGPSLAEALRVELAVFSWTARCSESIVLVDAGAGYVSIHD